MQILLLWLELGFVKSRSTLLGLDGLEVRCEGLVLSWGDLRDMGFDLLEIFRATPEVVRVRVNKLEGEIVDADGPLRIAPLIFHNFVLEMCVRGLAQSLCLDCLPFILTP